jgi:hypothetical protein
MGVAASDGGFQVKMEMRSDWQNLSIWISESVILGESKGDREGDCPAEGH